ncbi:hypothetical protein E9993_01490 [Labilibacter sediminis]|nr:hypothetical protein E9993_01490 [Labilibacter sediminis]
MKIKRIYIPLMVIFTVMCTSCYDNSVKEYSGPSQVRFIEERGSMIVDNTNPVYSIGIGVNKAVNKDRTYEIMINESSSAIEGEQFEFVNKQVLIPAGEVIGTVGITGVYENSDPLGVELSLYIDAEDGNEVANYSNTYDLSLFKFCNFDQSAFVGTFHVIETDAWNRVYEYEVDVEAGDDPFSIYVTGLWAVDESPVQIIFKRATTGCYIPDQFFFDEPGNYDNAWIKSLSDGTYNSCLGTIEGLEYFIYPKDGEDGKGWDRGTFDMYRLD